MGRKSIALLLVALTTGCGYHTGFLTREDIHKVAVPVFSNDTFYRNLEIDLTRAVVDRMEKETPYELTDASAADAILEGRIVSYRKTVLSENRQAVDTEALIALTVEVTLRDTRNGAVLSRKTVRDGGSFSIFAGQNEFTTRTLVYTRIAQQIVEKSFERDW